MKKIVCCLGIYWFMIQLPSVAQKVEVKEGKILLDTREYAAIKKEGCGFNTVCQVELFDTSGKKEIVIVARKLQDWQRRSSGNPQGYVYYLEFIFLGSGQKAETANMSFKLEKMASFIVKHNFFKEGRINNEAANEFVLINGCKYSNK
ncbi:MAG: hypothetical protein JNK27_05765 [Chitinophagaceae bacterium]|nr:hypothetical protein [Chitinophagaceae bacterium]